ncbi:PPE domain-containing protein [Nocardia cyriacigeorgica]|uniref:PPE domain-containing protein n=1 Tax=Nocardia cyriacigeorgica TaxID=135487 RepID=UPI002455EB65|nr:hypothetical protein [Nocardia cyriacigeorgica]
MRDMPRTAERGAHQRVDPDYASTVEVFDSLTHHQIHTAVQQLAPATLLAGQQAWQTTATGLTDALDQAHTEIRSAIADGWRGGAAQQAAAAVRDFEQLGRQLADVMTVVGQRLGQAGDAAEALRGAVPGPSDAEPDLAAALLDPARATDNVAAAKTVENSRQDVVRVMESIYTTAFIPTGAAVPAFPDAPAGAAAPAPAAATPGPVSIVVPDIDVGSPISQPPTVTVVAATVDQEPGAPEPPAAPEPADSETQAPATIPAAAAPVVPAAAESTPQTPATTPAAATTAPASAAPVPSTDRPAAIPATAPASTVAASASVAGVGAVPSNTGTSDDQRKREEKRQDSTASGGDAIAGMSAGAMGGLMGGALAAADTTRSGPAPVAPKPAPANTDEFDDEDDDLHYVDDELTFLEPAGPGGELIGSLDPTTPPVLGEWTEHE